LQVEDAQHQLLYFTRQKKLIDELVELYNQIKASGKNVKRKVSRTHHGHTQARAAMCHH
jgi:hypothetical protein